MSGRSGSRRQPTTTYDDVESVARGDDDDDETASAEPEDQAQFWEVPLRLPGGHFLAHVRATDTESAAKLLRHLRNGRPAEAFVLDDGYFRQLHFSFRYTQSQMDLRDPDALTLAYTQKMMAFLLFQPNPRHIVNIGLGGGSLTKFCYRQLERSRITTIEIDANVIGFAPLFKVPEPDARLRIVHGDGAAWFRTARQLTDAVLVDGCDRHGIAPALCEPAFHASVKARLRPGGVLVVNLIGTTGRAEALTQGIRELFEDRVLVLPVSEGGNRIVFALNHGAPWPPDWEAIRRRAPQLEQRHGLEFVRMAKRLESNARRRRAPAGKAAS